MIIMRDYAALSGFIIVIYEFVNPSEIVVCPRLWPVGTTISPF